jgi:hypothetical protein
MTSEFMYLENYDYCPLTGEVYQDPQFFSGDGLTYNSLIIRQTDQEGSENKSPVTNQTYERVQILRNASVKRLFAHFRLYRAAYDRAMSDVPVAEQEDESMSRALLASGDASFAELYHDMDRIRNVASRFTVNQTSKNRHFVTLKKIIQRNTVLLLNDPSLSAAIIKHVLHALKYVDDMRVLDLSGAHLSDESLCELKHRAKSPESSSSSLFRFFRSASSGKQLKLEALKLSGSFDELSSKKIDYLVKLLDRSTQLKIIDLSEINLHQNLVGITRILSGRNMQRLRLSGCNLSSKEDVMSICELLKSGKIKSLDLSGNRFSVDDLNLIVSTLVIKWSEPGEHKEKIALNLGKQGYNFNNVVAVMNQLKQKRVEIDFTRFSHMYLNGERFLPLDFLLGANNHTLKLTNLSDQSLERIGSQRDVTTLDLSGIDLAEEFRCRGNQISTRLGNIIRRNRSITHFKLQNCNISDDFFRELLMIFAHLRDAVHSLDVRGNQIRKVGNLGVLLERCPRLTELHVPSNIPGLREVFNRLEARKGRAVVNYNLQTVLAELLDVHNIINSEHNEKVKWLRDFRTERGENRLHVAVRGKDYQLVDKLLATNLFDVNETNAEGCSAFDLACDCSDMEMVAMLKNAPSQALICPLSGKPFALSIDNIRMRSDGQAYDGEALDEYMIRYQENNANLARFNDRFLSRILRKAPRLRLHSDFQRMPMLRNLHLNVDLVNQDEQAREAQEPEMNQNEAHPAVIGEEQANPEELNEAEVNLDELGSVPMLR